MSAPSTSGRSEEEEQRQQQQQPLQKFQDFWAAAAKQAGCLHMQLSAGFNNARSVLAEQHRTFMHRHFHQTRSGQPMFAAASLGDDMSSGKRKGGRRKQKRLPKPSQRDWDVLHGNIRYDDPTHQATAWYLAMQKVLDNRTVVIDGKRITLRELMREATEEFAVASVGGDQPTQRDIPRALSRQMVPGDQLRKGATKMQLRPDEEAALELDKLGTGFHIVPEKAIGFLRGGKCDFGFSMYGRTDRIKHLLQNKWAGQDPAEVLISQDFYDDVIENAHKLELTVMAIPNRPLDVNPLLAAFKGRLKLTLDAMGKVLQDAGIKGIKTTAPGKALVEDQQALDKLAEMFNPERLEVLGLAEKGALKKDGKLIFTAGQDLELHAEGVTPGILKDQEGAPLAILPNAHLTHAVMDLFLGQYPIDIAGKLCIGEGLLYAANGFKFGPNPENPGQIEAQKGPDGEIIMPAIERLEADFSSPTSYWLESDRRKSKAPLLQYLQHAREVEGLDDQDDEFAP